LRAKRSNPSFSFSFYFAKSKALATFFLEQARKKQRTCHAGCIVPSGYPRIFNFARALRDSLLFTTTTSNSPHALSSQNQKYISDTNAWVQGCILCHCFVVSLLAMKECKMDSRLRGNDREWIASSPRSSQ
jgi:hypothetical protein